MPRRPTAVSTWSQAAGVNSTAVYVDAGGMNGMTNNVSVTSQANFLTIENIIATGNAAVAMNGGSLFEPSCALHRVGER